MSRFTGGIIMYTSTVITNENELKLYTASEIAFKLEKENCENFLSILTQFNNSNIFWLSIMAYNT